MNTLQLLYGVLAVGFIVLTVLLSIAIFEVIRTLMLARAVMQETKALTRDVNIMKDRLKANTGSIVSFMLSLVFGRRIFSVKRLR